MYAVIETGGKQYRVAIGDRLKVEKIIADEGACVKLNKVLMISDGDKVTVGSPIMDSPVTATVMSHGKAKKIEVFKMKRRKNYRRTQGHRQQYTELEITAIGSTKVMPNSDAASPTKTRTAVKTEVKSKTVAVEKKVEAEKKPKTAGGKLTDISGLGAVVERKLQSVGVISLEQLAQLDEKKVTEVSEKLGFKNTAKVEKWVEQAEQFVS